MFKVAILDSQKQQFDITLNQKHICSFSKISIDDKVLTEVRMSNGDVWHVVDPPYEQWLVDSFITPIDY